MPPHAALNSSVMKMRLAAIEAQLIEQARAERRRWQDIAALLMRVEQEKLWEGHTASFTAWVEGIARRADFQQSVFWRCLKAGRIYLELTGRDELDAQTNVSPEALELADKIRRHAPKAVVTEVLDRTLDGELSRTELRDLWATYRPAAGGANARGRLPNDAEEREQALAARRATWELEKRKPENRAEVRSAEIVAAFREASWLADIDQARAESRTNGLPGAIAAMLIVRRRPTSSDRLYLHALWTCVSAPQLADFAFDAPGGTDYMWLALTPELTEQAQSKAPRMLGLLELSRSRELRVVREAQKRPLHAQARIELLSSLLQKAYLWP
jgi:hypothetical protein